MPKVNVNLRTCPPSFQDGRSEESLAAALSSAPSSLAAQAVVATKILPQNCNDVRGQLEASLKRLKRDSVYLYQVHWPINERRVLGRVKKYRVKPGSSQQHLTRKCRSWDTICTVYLLIINEVF